MRRTHTTTSLLLVILSVIALALPAIVAAKETVDPATLTPPPPPSSTRPAIVLESDRLRSGFTDPVIVDEPSGVVCGGTELLFSQTRSVVGKRFYSAEGLLLRRHFHDDVSGTWTNPVTGATATFSGGSMTLHDLAVPGDGESGVNQISGSVRIYLPDGGTIIHQDAGRLVFDEGGTGALLSQSGQHPFEDFFGSGDTTALDEFCSALG